MKLEEFLYEFLTNMLHFRPGVKLEQAIHNYVYQGIVPEDWRSLVWDSPRTFEEECEKGVEYWFKYR